ncbi:hypothetical protein PBI_LAUER_2 [Gordonia phage Lauer]|uniref:Uncharacterized protein n=1 Tax=Gordonia phage Lauer TaxID=2656538 RepID=A0A649VIZ2_9CAUD|nr:hypothetical protein PP995_gp02 [Gordonia phage Lauer]QGJ92174.1 hypothetical protein PBI_LAUER_2 [Gordonia phage Lauer]
MHDGSRQGVAVSQAREDQEAQSPEAARDVLGGPHHGQRLQVQEAVEIDGRSRRSSPGLARKRMRRRAGRRPATVDCRQAKARESDSAESAGSDDQLWAVSTSRGIPGGSDEQETERTSQARDSCGQAIQEESEKERLRRDAVATVIPW